MALSSNRDSHSISRSALALTLLVIAAPVIMSRVSGANAAAKVGGTQQNISASKAAPQAATLPLERMKSDYVRPFDIPFPNDNPYSPRKLELGQKLFFDPRLSKSGAQSCSSCHNPSFAWSDGLAKGVGDGMNQLGRRSPSILNVAWGSIFMWDGRAADLEEQALGPIQSAGEMNMPLDVLMGRLQNIPEYVQTFQTVFPADGLTSKNVAKAIATYERTIVSLDTPFDQWIAGDEKAISDSAKAGFRLFNTRAGCSACHNGWNFTDDGFADIGLPGDDPGRGKFIPGKEFMQHAFKTPGLRDIAARGPYMHDGSMKSLAEVIDHYDRGGIARPSRSASIKELNLTPREKADLIAFLATLSANQRITASLPSLPH